MVLLYYHSTRLLMCLHFSILMQVHCKFLQGFTGALYENQGAGISNLWEMWVTCNPHKCNGETWVSGYSYITLRYVTFFFKYP